MSKSVQPLVTIGIVTCNSADYIQNCLKSLAALKYTQFEVVIFDNNSSDTTLERISKVSLRKSTVLTSKHNVGFAAAHNTIARKSKAKYLVILNPDTYVDPLFLSMLVKVLEKDTTVIAVQPLVYLFNTKKINLTGKVTHFLGFDWIRNYTESTVPPAGAVFSISGSGVCVRRELFLSLGGFDETYFMYYEDTDFSWRALLCGYKLYFEPKSIMFHDYKYIPKETYLALHKKLFLIERNRLTTVLKNYSAKSLFFLIPAQVGMEIGMLAYACASGWGKAKLSSYFSLLQLLPNILTQRAKVQAMRSVSDVKIMQHFTGEITFAAFQNPVLTHFVNPLLKLYRKVLLKLVTL